MKYFITRLSALLLILGVLSAAQAATVTAVWSAPTTNTDGSALPASQITQYRMEYGTCVGTAFGTRIGDVLVAGNALTATTPNLGPGTYCLRVYTKTSVEGPSSGTASIVVPVPTPNAPTNLTITLN